MKISELNNDDILEFRLPRWNELPDIDLYMDQVVSILEKHLKIFAEPDTKLITSAMINNYVKQKVVQPPVNKRYSRMQLSYLFAVCILKKVLSISDICRGMEKMLAEYHAHEAYDIFCEDLEASLRAVFTGRPVSNGLTEDASEGTVSMKAALIAFADIILIQRLLKDE